MLLKDRVMPDFKEAAIEENHPETVGNIVAIPKQSISRRRWYHVLMKTALSVLCKETFGNLLIASPQNRVNYETEILQLLVPS
jgi:hypothetical protein